ncbi:hypothetical protein QTN47_15065 [Danxiaibacter flavus]|uniref:Glycosyl hydrolase family 95 catalytic domain-containing protein n=1 Tax=Danxiaibacter flavus TaxID=3049108 RepID=A0ABV3ZG13_9BACT|nr:hypothetical protein QNM32_15075 [Chitinophagaceae bacterium DXS]
MKLTRHLFVFTIALISFHLHAQTISAEKIIKQYRNVFSTPPAKTPGTVAVDAPLLGNGFTAVAISGKPEQQNYYLARNDFWRLKSGFNESYPAVLGKIQISVPSLTDASYHIEQDLYDATTIADFHNTSSSVRIISKMMAMQDILTIEIINNGKDVITGNALLTLPEDDQFHVNPPLENKFTDTSVSGNDNGTQWIARGFTKDVTIKTFASAALKIVGDQSHIFTISPSQKAMIVCSFSGNNTLSNCIQLVKQNTKRINSEYLNQANTQHQNWWHHFWNESWINIEDSVIAHQYYASQYTMASCSRDAKFPPGIFGSWVTREIPAWNGDYHLNYNYTAPFYALYSSNHLQQALPYEAPLLDFMQRGKYYSQKIAQIPDGILYPVGIGPLGIETTRENDLMRKYMNGYISEKQVEDEGLFFGQKSNAAYCAVNFSMQFYKTYDIAFTKRVYPFVKAVAVFWQHYLKKENDRYIILNDAIHEGTIGTKNPILSLGLVPSILKTAIDMSSLLHVDESVRKDWQNKHDSIAPFPLQEKNGRTVFRYSEKGTAWWDGNTLGIQHIYPGGQIGLNSDSSLLQTARNTIDEMQRWLDMNGSNSFFPAAVRVGYNADTILQKLREYSLHTYPNGFQLNNPHGIENCSTVPNTINEMLCMSHQNTIRVFEVWPKTKDAAFEKIRCDGAFLVSSALKDQSVQYIKIMSEKGKDCVLKNPWPNKQVIVKSNKRKEMHVSGAIISFNTAAGEELMLLPG